MSYRLMLLDTFTGESVVREFDGDFYPTDWAEGNDSCDCNRFLYFHETELSDPTPECGDYRFAVEWVRIDNKIWSGDPRESGPKDLTYYFFANEDEPLGGAA